MHPTDLSCAYRETPRRILSVVSDPEQPEPDAVDDVQYKQIARIDEGFLAWHFRLRDAGGNELAAVNRAFRGFGREVGRTPLCPRSLLTDYLPC